MAESLNARFRRRHPGGFEVEADLRLPAGRPGVTVLLGPSGCGKTTVLRCVAGLDRPQEGRIEFAGETWCDAATGTWVAPAARGVGMVFQDYALFPHLTAAGNVAYGLRGAAASAREREVSAWLEQFGLAGLGGRRPRELSGGQQQRLALARALAARPRLLLLDEPLSALEPALRGELRAGLRRWLAEAGIPVLLVTHDREEALALGDELVVMLAGRLRQAGPVLDVLNRPADGDVARLVGVETVQPGRVLAVADGLATVEAGAARLVALAGPEMGAGMPALLCIRGEDVILQAEEGTGTSVRNRLAARVVAVHPGTPLQRVELDAGFPLSALVTRAACAELQLQPGRRVWALVKAPAVHVIPRPA
ncbi:MAG: hypothetical protein RJA22_872 [Verrucomicrobiota bacterium]|jgi:molybdate transport system ATP-binding protein